MLPKDAPTIEDFYYKKDWQTLRRAFIVTQKDMLGGWVAHVYAPDGKRIVFTTGGRLTEAQAIESAKRWVRLSGSANARHLEVDGRG